MSDSIRNLVRKIQRYNARKVDHVKPASVIVLTEQGYEFDGKPISVTPTAQRMLLSLAKIPPTFFIERLAPDEQKTVFNRLYGEIETEYRFRFHRDTLYGVVSVSYVTLDNIVIVDLLKAAVSAGIRLYPVQCILEPDISILRLVPEEKKAGGVIPQIFVSNSENGLAALNLMAGVYRVECGNGLIAMVSESRSRWIHAGNGNIKIPDLNKVLLKSIEITEQLRASVGIPVSTERKIQLLWHIKRELGLDLADRFVRAANEKYRGAGNLFGIVNALTDAAKDFEPMRRTQIEVFAGELLGGMS